MEAETISESVTPSGRAAEKVSLPTLQSKMKCDPEGYEAELSLVYAQFKSSVELFQQQAALSFTSVSGVGADPTVAKDLGDRAMFLSHMTPFYPTQLMDFPKQLSELLMSSGRTLPSGLRAHITQALILLMNRKLVDLGDTIALFMELQTLGDKNLKKTAFSHVVNSIKRMNQKHKNDPKNRALQNILFTMLQQEDEAKAKRSLITLNELHRRKVWFDDRTANAICMACFHSSTRIMIAALSFLLDFENIECDDNSDDSDSADEQKTPQPQVLVNKEAIYKANHKGTKSSKKKKQAKLQRVVRSMKKQQRVSSRNTDISYYSPLNHLKDPQGFVEKLFSRLQSCNERFEVKMMMLKVIARTIGLHRLILLNFYPYIQKYVQPHQRDVTSLLAAAVQACHDMVPPDAVESLFRQVVNQFVHDKSRPEAISVGLNVVREICLRIPLLMTEDLLQDLVLYKKSKEKSVTSAARSLLTLFREVCPSLLIKKDRGRPIDPKAKPKAFGEMDVASNVPGIELLDQEVDGSDNDMDDNESLANSDGGASNILSNDLLEGEDFCSDEDDEVNHLSDTGSEDIEDMSEDEYDSDNMNDADDNDNEVIKDLNSTEEELSSTDDEIDDDSGKKSKAQKRKFSDFDGQLDSAGNSLRALKRLAGATMTNDSSEAEDRILSNEDFQRIRELEAKREARAALTRHGFKLPSSDQLSSKRVNPATLEANIRRKQTKEEKLAVIRAEREERGEYKSKSFVKKKKTGGKSNREKEHKKIMPLAAKRHKNAKSRVQKKIKQQRDRSGKQFRGRKAWK